MIELTNVIAGEKVNRQATPVEPVKKSQRGADEARQEGSRVAREGQQPPQHARQNAQPNRKDLQRHLEMAQEQLSKLNVKLNASLSLSINDDSDKLVIRLQNRDTGETIRQFPSDELLALAARLKDVTDSAMEVSNENKLVGVLVDLRR